jgi:fatty-acyl-CoA synthase
VPAPAGGDDVMATLKLRPGVAFDPLAFFAFLGDQSDLGSKWTPRYVRVADELPETSTNKVLKRELARQRWDGADPIWWRDGRHPDLRPLDEAGRARLRADFADHGRAHVLD